jgi:hypothetical protein
MASMRRWNIEPFHDPNPFVDCAQTHRALTAVILLKVHPGKAQGMLSENDRINLVNRQCNLTRNLQFS